MAVILANTTLSARKKQHAYAKDAQGTRVAQVTYLDPVGPFPGSVLEPPDGDASTATPWSLRADMRLWPLRPDDELTDGDGRTFIVRGAKRVRLPGYDDIDYVQVKADLSPPYTP